MVTVAEIAGFIEKIAPPALAEPWDKVGLQVGRAGASAAPVTVCLDVTDAVIDEALACGSKLIICHHPLIFGDFTGPTDSSPAGRLALRAAEAGLGIYAAHTNLDKAPGGISDCMAAALGLTGVEVLEAKERLLKLVVFVPSPALGAVKSALGDAGAGLIGLYSHCSFSSPGIGSFRPLPGASPAEGEVGRDNEVEEYRLEVEVAEADAGRVVAALLAAHPYEEVAYDLYELRRPDRARGLGRVGNLRQPASFEAFIDRCREVFGRHIRYAGGGGAVKRAAVCGGSGGALTGAAAAAGADILVTGDIKLHNAQAALAAGLAVVDAGHDATEVIGMIELGKRLRREFDIKVLAPESIGSIWRGLT